MSKPTEYMGVVNAIGEWSQSDDDMLPDGMELEQLGWLIRTLGAERDEALARVADLEDQLPTAEELQILEDLVSLGGTYAEEAAVNGPRSWHPFTADKMRDLAWGGYKRAFEVFKRLKGRAMRVDWDKANEMYQQMFGEDMDVKHCRKVVEEADAEWTHLTDEEILECLSDPEDDPELSRGQADCIEACLLDD